MLSPGKIGRTKILMSYSLDNLSFYYLPKKPIIKNLHLELERGCSYVLLGTNGSGKTTFLRILNGLLKPVFGSIRLNDTDLHSYKRSKIAQLVSFVPQNYTVHFPFTVYETVLMGRYPYKANFSDYSQKDHQTTLSILEKTGLSELAYKKITEISGGEKQRVALARSLCQQTPILLLDEPFSNLDIHYSLFFIRLFKDLVQKGSLVVTSVHDLIMAPLLADKVLFFEPQGISLYTDKEKAFQPEILKRVFKVNIHFPHLDDGKQWFSSINAMTNNQPSPSSHVVNQHEGLSKF
ncbi:MAG TPA: ABC transporter [Candidatus Atribacteria bacterium]|nr:ABC transporter [Candidatus Atribacteria bacterium]